MTREFIKNMNYDETVEMFRSMGHDDYRARQLFNWLYERNAESFDDMTDFSKDLRKELHDRFIISPLAVKQRQVSALDGTEKYLFRTADGHYIESVLLKSENVDRDKTRLTICISSQVGCAMGCAFCETAKIGFKRNLQPAEILDQICQVRRASGAKNNNIVFMGMGEPFMNYENVIKSADIMNYSFGFHISVRKITISTCGLQPVIERFIEEKQPYNLAISLNDTEPEKRRVNMPVENKYPIEKIGMMLREKFPVSRNRLTIEYIMRKDNISRDDARRLKKMFRYGRIKLNLIELNRGSHDFDIPEQEDVENFIKELEIMNVPVSVRKSLGSDISGACGQLSGKNYS